jgi:GNAT superfamily N-acetyltransferase
MDIAITFASSALEKAQIQDLRRSVLCGELHWPREIVEDDADGAAQLALATLGAKPVATGRLIEREGCFYLELVAVLQRFRALGIGRSLVEAIEARARQAGATRLRVLAPDSARDYFGKLGYLPLGSAASALEKSLTLSDGEAGTKAL